MLTGTDLVPHPAAKPRHSIAEKLLAFHTEHKSDTQQTLLDIDLARAQWTDRTYQEERRMLKEQLDDPECRRRRGPLAVAKIIPMVLARMGADVIKSTTEGQDPD